MDHITKQFEAFNWVDKILLFAADVKGQFLQSRGAETIKKLVGGDPLNAERKGGHEHIEIAGEFNLIVTSNSRLKVKLDGDSSAWRRRLLTVHYGRLPPKERIPDFAGLLVREEGAGILNFALQGLAELRRCLEADGRFPRSDRQTERIDKLLDESDSVRAFVREGLWKKAGCTISVDQVVNGYRTFCETKGWDGVTEKQVKDQLKDLIFEYHREVQQRKSSPRHWNNLAVVS
jgi:putative DNA primase/helicase